MTLNPETVPARHETPDVTELRRLAELCTSNPDFPHDGIGSQVRALPVLADRLAHMTEARDNARAEVERLRAELEKPHPDRPVCTLVAPEPPPADRSWLATERIHACPGASCRTCRDLAEVCGNSMRSSTEHAQEAKALAAKVERVRALHFGEYVEDEDQNRCFECGDDWPCPTIRALDEEPQP